MEYEQEEKTCMKLLLEMPPVALCKIDILKFNFDGISFTALKMPRYMLTLQQHPKTFPEQQLRNAGLLSDAFMYMHEKGIVHMDIKALNIFTTNAQWVIGDFGSSKPVGDKVTSSNLLVLRSGITVALPKYDWLMLLLVFLRETLSDRNQWIKKCCDESEKLND